MFSDDLNKRILFFTGGTALRDMAAELSVINDLIMVNIITAFDSGGSSAVIRKEFDILAIGDIRNRMISLIIKKQDKEVSNLLKYRFGYDNNETLQKELNKLIDLSHPLIKNIKEKYKIFFAKSLKNFNDKKSLNFKLQNGSLGNFIILGNYLETENIYKTVKNITDLLQIKDKIYPVTDKSLHIGAILKNNQKIMYQHNITAKETPSLTSDIKKIFLSGSEVSINTHLTEEIKNADLIIYPIGSFYTSLLANFLVNGVDSAIKNNKNSKVYIPNTFYDSELNNRSLSFQVNEILKYLKSENTEDYLNYIIMDKNHNYPFTLDYENIDKNIKIIKSDIIDYENHPKISALKVIYELRKLLH